MYQYQSFVFPNFSYCKIRASIYLNKKIWAERNNVLFAKQYGFGKGKGTRYCLAFLMTDINNSFEMKEQTIAAFLDILRAYDNVIIDIIWEVMVE
jgi:hypothetical protein